MKIRRVDYYPDDFLVGTSRLTCEEKGAYWVVCSLIYSTGGPVPNDDPWMAHMCGLSLRRWKTVKASLLAVGKLDEVNGSLQNTRSLTELDRAMKRTNSAQTNGQNGGRPPANQAQTNDEQHANSDGECNPNNEIAKPGGFEYQKAINHQSSSISHQKYLADFEQWWAECRVKKSKNQALKAFTAAMKKPGVTLEILITGMRRYLAEQAGKDPKFLKYPATWLNSECWTDEPISMAKPGNMVAGSPEWHQWRREVGIDA